MFCNLDTFFSLLSLFLGVVFMPFRTKQTMPLFDGGMQSSFGLYDFHQFVVSLQCVVSEF